MSSSGSHNSRSFNSDPIISRRSWIITMVVLSVVAMLLVTMVLCYRWVWVSSRYGQWDWRWRWRWRWRGDIPLSTLQADAGLQKRILDALPTFVYSKSKIKVVVECSVCINEFQENETARVLPNCNHCFHDACINQWLQSHSTCPLCRTKIRPQGTSELERVQINFGVAVDEESFSHANFCNELQLEHGNILTVEMSSDVAHASIVVAEMGSRGEGLKNILVNHPVIDNVGSKNAIYPSHNSTSL